jgi:hypothetical protein
MNQQIYIIFKNLFASNKHILGPKLQFKNLMLHTVPLQQTLYEINPYLAPVPGAQFNARLQN